MSCEKKKKEFLLFSQDEREIASRTRCYLGKQHTESECVLDESMDKKTRHFKNRHDIYQPNSTGATDRL